MILRLQPLDTLDITAQHNEEQQNVTETNTMNTPQHSNLLPTSPRTVAFFATTLGLSALLSGCSAGNIPSNFGVTPTPATITVTGHVHGGQQPVSGASVQLYTVSTSGPKTLATPILNNGVTITTDANGGFTLTGQYSCSSATYVYLTATGGNPGAGVNSALSLVGALGLCANLPSVAFVSVDETTTVTAAYALAPFASDLTHIGDSGSFAPGISSAFANAQLLSPGVIGTTNAVGVTLPATTINSLGNILASCVNSAGPTQGGCPALFSATGATDTFGAALAMARNPGSAAITGLYPQSSYIGAPFGPTLSSSSAPNDYALAVSFAGPAGTLATPYGIAIDATGNAWVTNESGTNITEFSPAGAVLATPAATGLVGAQGIAIDKTSSNVWVANTAGNSVVNFGLTAGLVTATKSYTAGGITAPSAIALDSAGNAFIANFNGNSVTELSSAGAALNGSPFTGNANNITVPSALALDKSGNVYVTSGQGVIVELSHTGVYTATLNDGALQAPSSLALDPTNRVVATGFTTGSTISGALGEFTSGTSATVSPVTSGLATAAGIASDGTSFWVANSSTSGSLAQFTYGGTTPVASSPASGFGTLNTPLSVAIDPSGSIWTTNSGSNTLTKFIGLAVPVVTPLSANVGP